MAPIPLLFLVPLVLWWMGLPAPAHAQTPAAVRSCLPPEDELAFDPEGWETDFCERSVLLTEIVSGGPPRDGIPPIDAPRFTTVGEADDWLGGRVAIVNASPEARGLPIGGTCVNVGCVPSKTMIRAAEAVRRAQQTPFEGVRASGEVTDFSAVTRQAQALVQDLREHKYVDVVRDDPNVMIVEGRACLRSAQAVEIVIERYVQRIS